MNDYFLFPFEQIQKGSRIIIYGAGDVGQNYYRQIKLSNYCEFLSFADMNYKLYHSKDFNIKSPNLITDTNYDYVIVASDFPEISAQIKDNLIEMNIPKDKIILSTGRKLHNGKETLYSFDDLIFDTDTVISSFFNNADCDIRYFNPIINAISMLNDNNDKLLILDNYLNSNANWKYKIILLRVLYEAKKLTPEQLKLLSEIIYNLSDEYSDLKYWLNVDLNFMPFYLPQCIYNEYYIDRRKITQSLADFYYNKDLPNISINNDNKKVAIICHMLHSSLVSVSKLVFEYANELTQKGYDVTIFVEDSAIYYPCSTFINCFMMQNKQSISFEYEHKKYLNEKVNVYYNHGYSIKERINNVINAVYEFNPSFIINNTDDFSVACAVLYKSYPIIFLPSRGYASSSFFHKYVTKDTNVCVAENEKYHSINNNQIVEMPVIVPYNPPKKIIKRSDYNISNNDFVLVTVGSRLDTEITEEFADITCYMLKNHHSFRWLIVCPKLNDYINQNYSNLIKDKQIIFLTYESDLPALYQICDAYLNPDRMGGGVSIIWAMQQRIPIITTSFISDITQQLGAENAVDGNYYDLINYAISLSIDRKKYDLVSNTMKERAEMYSHQDIYISAVLETAENLINNRRN